MKRLQVAILCGGLATRMRPLATQLPKSLFPVGGRPFIDWQLEAVRAGGATDVLLCIGHQGTAIAEHVGDGERYGLRVACSDEGETRRGTGGALRLAASRGLLQDRVVVQYGDSYLVFDHAALGRSPGEAVLAVYKNDGRFDASNTVVDRGRVVHYRKGTTRPDAAWIDYGAAALDGALLAGAPDDLAALYGRLADAGRLVAFEVDHRFHEIGSPAGLAELDALLGGTAR